MSGGTGRGNAYSLEISQEQAEVLSETIGQRLVHDNFYIHNELNHVHFDFLGGFRSLGTVGDYPNAITPAGCSLTINSETILRSENFLTAGIKPPRCLSIYRILGLDESKVHRRAGSKIFLKGPEYERTRIKINEAMESFGSDSSGRAAVSDELWIDDGVLVGTFAENLKVSLHGHELDLLDDDSAVDSLMPHHKQKSACCPVLTLSDKSRCDLDDCTRIFSGKTERCEHENKHNGMHYESPLSAEVYGNVVFRSDLGSGGTVGLFAKRLNSQKRRICSGGSDEKLRTWRTLKYSYYVIVECTAGREAEIEYAKALSSGRSIGSFVSGPIYNDYMRRLVENARRLAFRFSECIGVACEIGPSLPSPSDISCAYLNCGFTENCLGWAKHAKKLHDNSGSLGFMSSWSSWLSGADCCNESASCSTAAGTTADLPEFGTSSGKLWDNVEVKLGDGSTGAPAWCKEKFMQFSHELRLHEASGHFGETRTFVQVHGESTSGVRLCSKRSRRPGTPECRKTRQTKVMVRLGPLQGYLCLKVPGALLAGTGGRSGSSWNHVDCPWLRSFPTSVVHPLSRGEMEICISNGFLEDPRSSRGLCLHHNPNLEGEEEYDDSYDGRYVVDVSELDDEDRLSTLRLMRKPNPLSKAYADTVSSGMAFDDDDSEGSDDYRLVGSKQQQQQIPIGGSFTGEGYEEHYIEAVKNVYPVHHHHRRYPNRDFESENDSCSDSGDGTRRRTECTLDPDHCNSESMKWVITEHRVREILAHLSPETRLSLKYIFKDEKDLLAFPHAPSRTPETVEAYLSNVRNLVGLHCGYQPVCCTKVLPN